MKTSILISVFTLAAGIIATPVLDATIPKEVPRDLKSVEVRDALSERGLEAKRQEGITGQCACGQCINGKTCCTICSNSCGGNCVLWCGIGW
ncbi:hypothetical protein AA313_de0205628 [Arthrobotrys entomopaga]|nr:hypothetical protein AA313_de0205628 [Arthrobotrys entomopaga]